MTTNTPQRSVVASGASPDTGHDDLTLDQMLGLEPLPGQASGVDDDGRHAPHADEAAGYEGGGVGGHPASGTGGSATRGPIPKRNLSKKYTSNSLLTQSRLKELLSYDPETGVFTHLTNRGYHLGLTAGYLKRSSGYWVIEVDGKKYYAHRLAWLYTTGSFPAAGMDHRDGNRSNNVFTNLREATAAENNQNRVIRHQPSSAGYTGVYYSPKNGLKVRKTKPWRSRIKVGRKTHTIGYFATPEEAHAAYLAAKAQLHTFSPTLRTA